VIGRLFTDPKLTRVFDDFYDRRHDLTEQRAGLKLHGADLESAERTELMRLDLAARHLSESRKDVRDVIASPSMSMQEKASRLGELHDRMIGIAKSATGKGQSGMTPVEYQRELLGLSYRDAIWKAAALDQDVGPMLAELDAEARRLGSKTDEYRKKAEESVWTEFRNAFYEAVIAGDDDEARAQARMLDAAGQKWRSLLKQSMESRLDSGTLTDEQYSRAKELYQTRNAKR
jgi:hypothetical protein